MITLPVNSLHGDVIEYLVREINAESYLEIGVQEGKSLRRALTPRSVHRLLLCDDWGWKSGGSGRGDHQHIDSVLAEYGLSSPSHVIYLDGQSQVLIPQYKVENPSESKYAICHIDGDHSHDGCLSDLINVWPICSRYLIVHDISMPQVWSAVLHFLALCNTGDVATAQIFTGGHGTISIERSLPC